MKIELSYDEVSVVCRALLIGAQEAACNAFECEQIGKKSDAKSWQEEAEGYRKVYEAVKAQRE
ncbi:hypothetical protein [Phascolarctobacterium succinatutens]|uniref:hypothetical protein n=1 Tax=Phascolarctobacterium succinatutens TaxID=626940 RepID=UPI0026F07908|nr:hypothetical protein [Phascolarctobacterium succinatutens]